MNTVILGNFISLLGCLVMVLIGFLQKKKHILAAQCFQFGLLGLANLILGATSGFVSGVVGIVRNLYFSSRKSTTTLKILFIAVQVLLSLPFVGNGLVDWLPVFAAVLFTWFIDSRSEIVIKLSIILAQVFWMIFDLYYHNFTAMAFDIFTILSNLAGILMIKKQK